MKALVLTFEVYVATMRFHYSKQPTSAAGAILQGFGVLADAVSRRLKRNSLNSVVSKESKGNYRHAEGKDDHWAGRSGVAPKRHWTRL
jgi:hypothetical protein